MSIDQPVLSPSPLQTAAGDAAGRPSTPAPRPRPAHAAVAVYATLALCALLYPQAVLSWLDDFEPNPIVDAARTGAVSLLNLSDTLGIAPLSGVLREGGKRLTRRTD